MIFVVATTVVLGAIAWPWFVRQFSLLGPAEVVVMQDFRSGTEWKILGMDGPGDRPWAYAVQVVRPRRWASDTVVDPGMFHAAGAAAPSRIAAFSC